MSPPERVVFDCNVYFQALLSQHGPARRLFDMAASGRLVLFASDYVLQELSELVADPRIKTKHRLTDVSLDDFFAAIRRFATVRADVPHVFDYARDPDDAHYIDLALAVDAKLVVSRDKDLLALRDAATAEGRDFLSRFPTLRILTPPEALTLLDDEPTSE